MHELNWGLIGGVVGCLFIYGIYSSVIKKKNNVQEALSGIDVQLKKRYDAIPNLLKAAAKFMAHEKKIFDEVTQLRTQAMGAKNYHDKFELEQKLSNAMTSFKFAAENYPELKSDKAVLLAMEGIGEAEEHIAAARRFYNSAVKEYKNALEIFPYSLVAAILGLDDVYPFFEATLEEKKSVNVDDYLK